MQILPIYYATVTGNAEDLAQQLEKRLNKAGVSSKAIDLANVKPKELRDHAEAFFIVSTWGDGEPPDEAFDFWEELESTAIDLTQLRYGVFGLGDSGYAEFNAFARALDERLAQCGAVRSRARVEADVDFDDDFDRWAKAVLQDLAPALRP
ncbi:MAG: flavodoxin family protein [Verrucomicrobiota bacterium JB022]|nr:flavodoxin family protein [Verrucomicrobiota bacterium JB022]